MFSYTFKNTPLKNLGLTLEAFVTIALFVLDGNLHSPRLCDRLKMSQLIHSAYFYVPLFKPMSVLPFLKKNLNSPWSSGLLMIISVELKSQGWSYVSCMVYNKLVCAVKGVRLKYKTWQELWKVHWKYSQKQHKALEMSELQWLLIALWFLNDPVAGIEKSSFYNGTRTFCKSYGRHMLTLRGTAVWRSLVECCWYEYKNHTQCIQCKMLNAI